MQQDLLRTLDLLRVSTVDFASQQKPGDELGLTQLLIRHIATTHADDFDSLVRHAVLAVVQEELRPLLRPPLGQVAPRPEGKEEGQGGRAQEAEEAAEEGNDDKEEEVEEDREVETSMNYSSIYPYDGDEIVSMQFSVDMKGDPSVLAYLNSQEASQQQQEEEDKQQPVPEPEPEEVEQTVSSIRKKRKSTAADITSPVSTRSARKKKNL